MKADCTCEDHCATGFSLYRSPISILPPKNVSRIKESVAKVPQDLCDCGAENLDSPNLPFGAFWLRFMFETKWLQIIKFDIHLIGLVGRVFVNGPGDPSSIPGRVIPNTFKMVLNATLLNTQQYKVRIKDELEQSNERRSALPYTLV